MLQFIGSPLREYPHLAVATPFLELAIRASRCAKQNRKEEFWIMGDAEKGPTRPIAHEMYEQLFNQGDNSVLERYVSADFVYKNPMQNTVGRQQIIDLVEAQRHAFRGFRQHVDEVVIDKESPSMAVSWTVTGTFERPFFAYQPTGKDIRFSGITLFKWKDGQAVEAWGFSNMDENLRGGGA